MSSAILPTYRSSSGWTASSRNNTATLTKQSSSVLRTNLLVQLLEHQWKPARTLDVRFRYESTNVPLAMSRCAAISARTARSVTSFPVAPTRKTHWNRRETASITSLPDRSDARADSAVAHHVRLMADLWTTWSGADVMSMTNSASSMHSGAVWIARWTDLYIDSAVRSDPILRGVCTGL